ncbi:MAG TPA: nuclear transport factor 2 family protein [Candidatus Dormibacteraeota bacterium]|nr:nuclear transport factor 2 family protein [Candidatus Dormibacteraeota bacterium]
MGAVEKKNEKIVKDFFKALSSGKLEKVRPLFHERATWKVMGTGIPGEGERKGRDNIIDNFLAPVRGMFVEGDPKVHIDKLICQGPFVAVEGRGLGKFKDGRPYSNRYAYVLELKDGRIYNFREYMDTYYVSQLGVSPDES